MNCFNLVFECLAQALAKSTEEEDMALQLKSYSYIAEFQERASPDTLSSS